MFECNCHKYFWMIDTNRSERLFWTKEIVKDVVSVKTIDKMARDMWSCHVCSNLVFFHPNRLDSNCSTTFNIIVPHWIRLSRCLCRYRFNSYLLDCIITCLCVSTLCSLSLCSGISSLFCLSQVDSLSLTWHARGMFTLFVHPSQYFHLLSLSSWVNTLHLGTSYLE